MRGTDRGAKKREAKMLITKRLMSGLVALGAVVSIGAIGSQAHADALFHNSTDQTVIFSMQCGDNATVDRWAIAPGADLSLYCTNPDQVTDAIVEVWTSRPPYIDVVRGAVYDGETYDFFYDSAGDVDITRI
jgi:hypothetical protein